MLSKTVNKLQRQALQAKTFQNSWVKMQAMSFSHGPYNPLAFKAHLVPEELPS